MKSYYKLVRHDGNRDLFQAVEMSVMAIANGYAFNIHAQGLRGTGKTSIMRAVRDILPPIVRIKDCIYNCNPAEPHCPEHRNLSTEAIAFIGTEVIPRPFLEISHSAKIGTVVGSIDLQKLTDNANPTAALLPGTIPRAHRGIIFVDEINRLADTSPEIADVLLDLMGTKPGRIQVEETGLPTVELPVSAAVWAASNPDEDPGPLVQIRKQLADRFDFVINMGRATEYEAVKAILEQKHHGKLSLPSHNKMMQVAGRISDINCDDTIRSIFASIYIDFSLESLRAVESMEAAAGLSAMLAGRDQIMVEDIAGVVPFVLGHRTDNATLTSIQHYLESITYKAQPSKSMLLEQPSITKSPEDALLNESGVKLAWWKRIWANFRKTFGIQRFGANPWIRLQQPKMEQRKVSSSTPEQKGSAMRDSKETSTSADCNSADNSSNKKPTCSKSFQNRTDIMDPLQVNIIAPSQRAVPLSKLSIDQYINEEENKSHG